LFAALAIPLPTTLSTRPIQQLLPLLVGDLPDEASDRNAMEHSRVHRVFGEHQVYRQAALLLWQSRRPAPSLIRLRGVRCAPPAIVTDQPTTRSTQRYFPEALEVPDAKVAPLQAIRHLRHPGDRAEPPEDFAYRSCLLQTSNHLAADTQITGSDPFIEPNDLLHVIQQADKFFSCVSHVQPSPRPDMPITARIGPGFLLFSLPSPKDFCRNSFKPLWSMARTF
jgi:hypothetical protein